MGRLISSPPIRQHPRRDRGHRRIEPVPDIHAQIGPTSGQVAVGTGITQTLNTYHGNVVNRYAVEAHPPRPRTLPIFVRPRQVPGLLNRYSELAGAESAVLREEPFEFVGEPGIGKSTLVRALANHDFATAFPDGVVCLPCNEPVPDLLQALFDTFYESDIPFKATEADVCRAMQEMRALLLLDDVEVDRDDLDRVMDTAPHCTFVFAAKQRNLWGQGETLVVPGLPLHESELLVVRELGRQLDAGERAALRTLHTSLRGNPLQLERAAALARTSGISLVEVGRDSGTATPATALTAQMTASLSDEDRRILAVLAVLRGALIDQQHLQAITEISDAGPALALLMQRHLVQANSPAYTLTGRLDETLWQAWDLGPWAHRVLDYFCTWSESRREAPRQILEMVRPALAIFDWGVREHRWREVVQLGRGVEGALALTGRWETWRSILDASLEAARTVGDRAAEAFFLHQLGTRALCLGETASAETILIQALEIRETLGDDTGVAVTSHNLAVLSTPAPPDGTSSTGGKVARQESLRALITSRRLLLWSTAALLGAMLVVALLVARDGGPSNPTPTPSRGPSPTAQGTIPVVVSTSIPTLVSTSQPTPIPSSSGSPPTVPPSVTSTLALTPTDTPTPEPTLAPPAITLPRADGQYFNTHAVELAGTAPTGMSVTLMDAGKAVTTEPIAAPSDGVWRVTLPDVPDGSHVYTAQARSEDGRMSGPSPPRTLIVDTAAPVAPIITAPTDGAGVSTEVAPLAMMGTAEPESSITVYYQRVTAEGRPDGALGQIVVWPRTDSAGSWHISPVPVPGVWNRYYATATDRAGNRSAPSLSVAVANGPG